jgi:hypothetical protein
LVKMLELVVGGHELDRTLRQVASLRHLPVMLGLDRPRTGQPHGLLEAGVGVRDHRPARRPGRQRWAVSLVRAHNLRPMVLRDQGEQHLAQRIPQANCQAGHQAGITARWGAAAPTRQPSSCRRPRTQVAATATASPRCAGSGLAVRTPPFAPDAQR